MLLFIADMLHMCVSTDFDLVTPYGDIDLSQL